MYQSFEISDFRCFSKLKVNNLSRVNLIAGVNNVGKTAFLEALFLHCGAYNPRLALNLNALRGIESVKVELGPLVETPWDWLFRDIDTSKEIKLVGTDNKTGVREIRLKVIQPQELTKISELIPFESDRTDQTSLSSEYPQVLELTNEENGQNRYYLILDKSGMRPVPIPPPPPFPTNYLFPRARVPLIEEAHRFGKLETKKQLNILTETLKIVDPRIDSLSLIVIGETPLIHADIGMDRFIPLAFMGDGMSRLASIVLAIVNSPNGVVLIDEIENGLHHSILHKVWQAIGKVARMFNTQVFATTHSMECVVAAHEAFVESGPYDFSLHRLERINESIHDVTYDEEALGAAIEMGFEVR